MSGGASLGADRWSGYTLSQHRQAKIPPVPLSAMGTRNLAVGWGTPMPPLMHSCGKWHWGVRAGMGASYPPPSLPTEYRAESRGGEPEAGAAGEATSPGQHMVSGAGQASHPGVDMASTRHLWCLRGQGGPRLSACALPAAGSGAAAVGLEVFAMGLGTRRVPLTALVPAKNKGQHLFGRGGQRHAWGPWRGCPTAGHRWAGGPGARQPGTPLVLGA